jgi:CheY-like chemotaxis protein
MHNAFLTPPAIPLSAVPRHTGTVLLVDDEPALLLVGRAILSTLGIGVSTAPSGEDAIVALQQAGMEHALPDVVLLDLTMPGGMSGLETFDNIRALYPYLPVVACSGFLGDGAEEVLARAGFADTLPKPYTPEALVTVVRRVLVRAGSLAAV